MSEHQFKDKFFTFQNSCFGEKKLKCLKYYFSLFRETSMRIRLFNLFDPFVNEYIRGCAYQGYQRRDPENFVHCNDLLHPGFGATFSFSTQLLFKHICN